ncbi:MULTISPECIES: ABC transporter permease [Rhizobiaceae]|uniref:Ribose transport system permease protein n=3 Tax=Rhizobiaceae TaxID=82115 RepID=A0A2S3YUF0_9HYPH|nr:MULTISPECIES: ABC transporter permease [Rhizobiaceae]AEI89628.1 ribose ABC transporter, permease protein [Sinorhizobium fredii GR64]AIC29658.1 sugar ABC transporter permease protein [Rhizobium sp. IE4771]MBB5553311.1 ribose transport system permease protein [Rhizobium lentis]MBB5563657.1 ribose transport system permease protein [Rhizobium lentis]MBB5570238.1 ribose transport system permease protein [Rhizobium lentis]
MSQRFGFPALDRSLTVPLVLFGVLLAAAAVLSPRLFTATGMGGAIIVAAPLILTTLALTPIVMAGRGSVDLSVGPLMGFVNVTLIGWLSASGYTSPLAVICWVVAVGALYQLLQALIIIYVRVAPIIVTLSSFLVLSGLNLMVMSRPGGVAPDWMMTWGAGTTILSPVLIIVLAALALWAVMRRTTFYSHLRMTGADERMAYTSGVKVDTVRICAHLLGGVFVGLAALSYTALISSGDPTQGSSYTLQAVTALVLGGANLAGGRGGALGSTLGALNMFLISYLLSAFSFGSVTGFVTQMAFGLILVASLLVNVFMTARRTAF